MKHRIVPAGTRITYSTEDGVLLAEYLVGDVDVTLTKGSPSFRPYEPADGTIDEWVADVVFLVIGQSFYEIGVVLPDGKPLDARELFAADGSDASR